MVNDTVSINRLKDSLSTLFNPLFTIGLYRLITLFDSLLEKLDEPTNPAFWSVIAQQLQDFEFSVPLLCCVLTMQMSVLSSMANQRFVAEHTNTAAGSRIGRLCFASVFCIAVMYIFTYELVWYPLWLGTYAVFCGINAWWNYETITQDTRAIHVYTNVVLSGSIAAAFVIFPYWWTNPWRIIQVMVVVLLVKWWQRTRRRDMRKIDAP